MKGFILNEVVGGILTSSVLLNSDLLMGNLQVEEPSTIQEEIVTGLIRYQHFEVGPYACLTHYVTRELTC